MKSIYLLIPLLIAAVVMLALLAPNFVKGLGEKLNEVLFTHLGRSGLVLGMAEINSRQKTAIAAGSKILASVQGVPHALVFTSPAAAAWAQNDTLASGQKIPKGSRILNSTLNCGALGSSVTADLGLRNFDTGVEVDLNGLGAAVAVASAGDYAMDNGALMAAGIDYVTTVDTEPVVTLAGANPTDDIQIRVTIWYLPPG